MKKEINFDILTDLNVSLEEPKIISVELENNNIVPLDLDAATDAQFLDVDITRSNNIDIFFKEYIKTSGSSDASIKVITVTQEDITDIDAAVVAAKITTPKDGMFLIVTSPTGGTMGYTYRKKEKDWVAFSGNVQADHVYFDKDIICAGAYTQVGNVNKGINDTLTIPAKGKSLDGIMKTIFTKELQPNKTEPSVNLTFSQAGAYEVGTTITPTYSASLNVGSYTYGPPTGVIATSWNVSDNNSHSSSAASGSFESLIVNDNTNYRIVAAAQHTEGAIAYTNLGDKSDPIVRIAAGTKSKTSSSVTGYRKIFYGSFSDLDEITSTIVRNKTDGGKAAAKTVTIKSNGVSGLKRFCVFIPTSSNLKIKLVMKTDGLATDITSQYSKTGTVQVDGANGHELYTSYDIWTYQPASIDSGEVHEITIG